MTPQDPLAGLHPLREPAAIGWWPPAPGWWALLVIVLASAALLGYFLRRRYRNNAYRRRALAQLATLRRQYQDEGNRLHYVEQLNALLKSVALVAYPRQLVAGRHGEAWRNFLNESLPPADHFTPAFDDAAYQRTPPGFDPDQLHRSADYWIRHHRADA